VKTLKISTQFEHLPSPNASEVTERVLIVREILIHRH